MVGILLWKQRTQLSKGKSSRVKVEVGTRLKSDVRAELVCQRI